MNQEVIIGAMPISIHDLYHIAQGAKVALDGAARTKMEKARTLVELKEKSDTPVYGVTTGFGALAEVKVSSSELLELLSC